MDKAEAGRIFEEVKENQRKLKSCDFHVFPPIPEPYVLGKKSTCTKCGGSMQHTDIHTYCKGFKAAGGDPNTVWPGFDKDG